MTNFVTWICLAMLVATGGSALAQADSNDTMASATPVTFPVGAEEVEVSGVLSPANDIDYYSFYLFEGDRMDITVRDAPASFLVMAITTLNVSGVPQSMTLQGLLNPDPFSIDIQAIQRGLHFVAVNRPLSISGASDASYRLDFTVDRVPRIVSVSPRNALPGDEVTVVVTGSGTHFNQSTSVDFGDGDVSVEEVELLDATSLRVRLRISPSVSAGARTVTTTTESGEEESETVIGESLFLVAPLPSVGGVSLQMVNAQTDAVTGLPKEVVPTPGLSVLFPVWSNRADRIAFVGRDLKGTENLLDDEVNVYVINLQEPAQMWAITDATYRVSLRSSLAWAPDDGHVAFGAVREGDDPIVGSPAEIRIMTVPDAPSDLGQVVGQITAPDPLAQSAFHPAYTRSKGGVQRLAYCLADLTDIIEVVSELGGVPGLANIVGSIGQIHLGTPRDSNLVVQDVDASGTPISGSDPIALTDLDSAALPTFGPLLEFPRWDRTGDKLVFSNTDVVLDLKGNLVRAASDVRVLENVSAILSGAEQPIQSLDDPRLINVSDSSAADIFGPGSNDERFSTQGTFSEDGGAVCYTQDLSATFNPLTFDLSTTSFTVMVRPADGSGEPQPFPLPFQGGFTFVSPGGIRMVLVNDAKTPGDLDLYLASVRVSKSVAEEGRSQDVTVADGSGLQVEIPSDLAVSYPSSPNAAPGTINIETPVLPAASRLFPLQQGATGMVRTFLPDGTLFSAPARITLHYTDEEMRLWSKDELIVLKFNEGTGLFEDPVRVVVRNPDENTITIEVNGFSTYGMGGQFAPGSIFGTVHNKRADSPIRGVSVKVRDMSITQETDEEGSFAIAQIPAGFYDLDMDAVGYKSKQFEVSVGAAGSFNGLFRLDPEGDEEGEGNSDDNGNGGSPGSGACSLATALHSRLFLTSLRSLRDNLLLKSPAGCALTSRYYAATRWLANIVARF